MHRIYVIPSLNALACLWLLISAGCAQNPSIPSIEAMLARVTGSVVAVGSQGASRGSAWCVGPNLFVTNAHVAQQPTEQGGGYLLSANGRPIAYRLVQSSAEYDLAILEANLDLPPLDLAETSAALGQPVFALGNPLGLGITVTAGIVSAEPRSIGKDHLLQIDAAVNPGNSGGPLVDSSGRVVGVVSARAAVGSGIGFAVPSTRITELLGSN